MQKGWKKKVYTNNKGTGLFDATALTQTFSPQSFSMQNRFSAGKFRHRPVSMQID